MKVLVTGGAGFIGTNLIKRLVNDGHFVVSIDNYISGKKENHIQGATYVEANLLDIKNHNDIGHYDIVYHLAALARIQPSLTNPVETFDNNVLSTEYICDYCRRYNIPLVFAGSSSIWSGSNKNPYTFSKAVGEQIVELYQKLYKLQATITRFYNVYGPYHIKQGDYCTVIGKWEHQYDTNQPLTIYGDGSKMRDFTHIDDIVEALVLIPQKNAWGHILELGRGDNYPLQKVADMFKHAIQYEDDKEGEGQISLCANDKAKEILEWEPVRNIYDYITEYIKK